MAIKFTPFRRLLRILSGNYMESGIIQSAPTGCGAPEATSRSWQLLPGSGLQGNFLGFDEANNPQASGLLQGTESIAVGCSTAVQSESMYVPDCEGYPQLITGGGYCPVDLSAKKRAIINAPASIFSGLTKRYVQAMYGSERFDMSNNEGQFRYPKLEISSMNPSGSGTDKTLIRAGYPNYEFVARSSQYDYFFVSKSGMTLQVFPMGFSATGIEIMAKLRAGLITGSTADQAESYALAYAKPDIDTMLATVTITGDTPAGEPLAYTWHGNSTGTAHTIVLHEELPAEKMYAAREYSLAVAFSSAAEGAPGAFGYNGRWYAASASITQIDDDKKWDPKDYTIWGHDYEYGKLYWMSGGWSTPYGTQTDDQTPLYSYYVGDAKTVHRITHTVAYSAGGTTHTGVGVGCGGGVTVDMDNDATTAAGYAGSKGVAGLTGSVHPSRNSYVRIGSTSEGTDPVVTYNRLAGPGNPYSPPGGSWWYDCAGTLFTIEEACGGSLGAYVAEGMSQCIHPATGNLFDDALYKIATLWQSLTTLSVSSVNKTGEIKGSETFAFVPFQSSDSLAYGKKDVSTMSSRVTTGYGDLTMIAQGGGDWYHFSVWGVCVPGYYEGNLQMRKTFRWNLNGLTSNSSNTEYNVSEISYTINVAVKNEEVVIDAGTSIPNWLSTLINPPSTENFKLIQNPANAITAIGNEYAIEFVADDIVQINNNFGTTGVGGIGWQ